MTATKLTERLIERLECQPGSRDRLVFDAEQRGLTLQKLVDDWRRDAGLVRAERQPGRSPRVALARP